MLPSKLSSCPHKIRQSLFPVRPRRDRTLVGLDRWRLPRRSSSVRFCSSKFNCCSARRSFDFLVVRQLFGLYAFLSSNCCFSPRTGTRTDLPRGFRFGGRSSFTARFWVLPLCCWPFWAISGPRPSVLVPVGARDPGQAPHGRSRNFSSARFVCLSSCCRPPLP